MFRVPLEQTSGYRTSAPTGDSQTGCFTIIPHSRIIKSRIILKSLNTHHILLKKGGSNESRVREMRKILQNP